jgi:hypothetical protein
MKLMGLIKQARVLLLAVAITLAGLALACGGLETEPTIPFVDTPLTETAIKDFTHQDLTVPIRTVVRWVNEDAVDHTSTGGTPDDPSGWDSGTVKAGNSFSFTFKEAGEFKYFCSIHDTMTATVTVTE